MGTRGWVAARPLVVVLALAPFAACSCDDHLVDMNFPDEVPPSTPNPGEHPKPPLVPGHVEFGLAAVASGNAGCDGAPLTLQLLVFGGKRPYTIRWDDNPDLVGTDSPKPIATGFGTKEFFVTVTDAEGSQVRTSATVTRTGLPTPSIEFALGSSEVCAGSEVVLDASTSVAADGSPLAEIAWDLDADGSEDTTGITTDPLVPFDGQRVRLTVTDAVGCAASQELELGVRPNPTPDVIFTEGAGQICAGGPVALDASGSTDADGMPVAAFSWDLDGDGLVDSVAAWTGTFVPAASGTASVTVTDAHGCSATRVQPLAINGNPVPAIAFVQGDGLLCRGELLVLDGSPSRDANGGSDLTYAWDLDGDSVTDATGPTPPPFVPDAGRTIRLTVIDAAGCSATATQLVAVRNLPVPDIAFTQGGALICAGGEVAVSGAGTRDADGNLPALLSWDFDGDGTADASGATPPAFTPAASTDIRLSVTDAAGCTATRSAQVEVNPLPIADAGPDRQVALGGAVRLAGAASGGTPAYSYAWNPASSLDDDATPRPLASPSATGVYTLSVTDAMGCVADDTVTVSVVGALSIDAGNDRSLCTDGGSALALSSAAAGGVAPLTYQWTANPPCGSCIANPTAPSTQVSPAADTVFTVTVRDANGTAATDTVAVTVRSGFSVDAGPDRKIDRGAVTQLGTPAQPGLTYTWTCDNWSCGLSDTHVAMPYVAPEGNTAYKVIVSDGETCTGSDTVIVAMDSRVIATVPTEGYTPWPRDALIWVVFDSDMDATTLNAANIHLIDPSDGTDVVFSSIDYNQAARTLTLDPLDRNYANNRPVVLVLRGGPNGIRTTGPFPVGLATDFVLEFNASSNGDGRAPNIAYAQPAAAAVGVATTTDVVVRFDEPVDPRSVTPTTFQINGIAATVTYDPRTYTANLRPTAPLAPNRAYTVRLNGVKDGPGNLTNLTWTFSTGPGADTTAPLVVTSVPQAGESGFDVAGTVAVTFSEPVDPATLDGLRLIDVASGFPISGEITYDEASRTAVLDPNRILEPNHAFQVVASGIADQAGNPMTGTFIAPFTTQSVRWLERFESGVAGWNLAAPWATHYQAARYGLLGLADSPTGNTAANANVSAVSPGFDVSGRADVALSFWNRRIMATTGTDAARVEYSTNNGATWNQAPSGSSLTGPIGWRLQTYTLPTNGSNQMQVRFRIQTDATVNLDGWFVDEIVVR